MWPPWEKPEVTTPFVTSQRALAGCTDALGKAHPQAIVCEANVARLGGDAAPPGMPSAGLVVWQ